MGLEGQPLLDGQLLVTPVRMPTHEPEQQTIAPAIVRMAVGGIYTEYLNPLAASFVEAALRRDLSVASVSRLPAEGVQTVIAEQIQSLDDFSGWFTPYVQNLPVENEENQTMKNTINLLDSFGIYPGSPTIQEDIVQLYSYLQTAAASPQAMEEFVTTFLFCARELASSSPNPFIAVQQEIQSAAFLDVFGQPGSMLVKTYLATRTCLEDTNIEKTLRATSVSVVTMPLPDNQAEAFTQLYEAVQTESQEELQALIQPGVVRLALSTIEPSSQGDPALQYLDSSYAAFTAEGITEDMQHMSADNICYLSISKILHDQRKEEEPFDIKMYALEMAGEPMENRDALRVLRIFGIDPEDVANLDQSIQTFQQTYVGREKALRQFVHTFIQESGMKSGKLSLGTLYKQLQATEVLNAFSTTMGNGLVKKLILTEALLSNEEGRTLLETYGSNAMTVALDTEESNELEEVAIFLQAERIRNAICDESKTMAPKEALQQQKRIHTYLEEKREQGKGKLAPTLEEILASEVADACTFDGHFAYVPAAPTLIAGDMHGLIKTYKRILEQGRYFEQNLKFLKGKGPKKNLFVGGDAVDRGPYEVQLIRAILGTMEWNMDNNLETCFFIQADHEMDPESKTGLHHTLPVRIFETYAPKSNLAPVLRRDYGSDEPAFMGRLRKNLGLSEGGVDRWGVPEQLITKYVKESIISVLEEQSPPEYPAEITTSRKRRALDEYRQAEETRLGKIVSNGMYGRYFTQVFDLLPHFILTGNGIWEMHGGVPIEKGDIHDLRNNADIIHEVTWRDYERKNALTVNKAERINYIKGLLATHDPLGELASTDTIPYVDYAVDIPPQEYIQDVPKQVLEEAVEILELAEKEGIEFNLAREDEDNPQRQLVTILNKNTFFTAAEAAVSREKIIGKNLSNQNVGVTIRHHEETSGDRASVIWGDRKGATIHSAGKTDPDSTMKRNGYYGDFPNADLITEVTTENIIPIDLTQEVS